MRHGAAVLPRLCPSHVLCAPLALPSSSAAAALLQASHQHPKVTRYRQHRLFGQPVTGSLGGEQSTWLPGCLSLPQAVTYVSVALERGMSPGDAALALVEEVLDPHSATPASSDNITALCVQFAPMPEVSA